MGDTRDMKIVDKRVATTKRRLTALAVGRAYWPLFVFIGLFLASVLAGVFDRFQPAISAVFTLVFFVGILLLVMRGARRYQGPNEAQAEDLLDRQSELRPISSLKDRPVAPARDQQSLWVRHRDRLLADVKGLRPPRFLREWRALDPFFLRFVVPLAVLAIAFIGWNDLPGRMKSAFMPDYGSLVGADNMVVEAWITPPEHSGQAPIFLTPKSQDLRVPEGSRITLRTAARSAPKLIMKAKRTARSRFKPTPDGVYEAQTRIMEDTRVSVNWWGERAAWRILASPDDVPIVEMVSQPTYSKGDRIEFSWRATDDYGVTKLELVMERAEPHAAAPEDEKRVRIALPGLAPREATDVTQMDLTRHAWAGLAVKLRVVATDGAGQEGSSETFEFTLPEKFFLDPLARAAQEVRVTVLRDPREYNEIAANPDALTQDAMNTTAANRIQLAPADIQTASLMLDTLTYKADRYLPNITAFLTLRTAHGMLDSASKKSEADAVAPLLWALAMKTEYGSAADALRRLEAARKALEQALRDGVPEEEIKRRMEAFRDAANNYLAARMAEALANGGQGPAENPDGQTAGQGPNMGGQDFEDMLNALEDLADTGASDQARKLLSDISNLLQSLEFSQGGSSGSGMPGMPGQAGENEGEQDVPQEEQELTDAMERLSDILREQRELNDDTLAQERGEQPSQSGEQSQSGTSSEGQTSQSGSEDGQGEQEGQQAGGQSGGEESADAQGGKGENTGDGTEGSGGGQLSSNNEVGTGEGQRPSGESLAERQARLGELVEQFARENGLGEGAGENALEGQIDPDALEGIRRAQRRAENALEDGNEARAAREQESATQALSEMSRGIAEQLDEIREARTGEARGGAESDPFGRPSNGAGNNGDAVDIPDAGERQRAKDILDELRKRHDDADTDEEREYLERLLDRF